MNIGEIALRLIKQLKDHAFELPAELVKEYEEM